MTNTPSDASGNDYAEFDAQLKEAMDGVLASIEATRDPAERYDALMGRIASGDHDG